MKKVLSLLLLSLSFGTLAVTTVRVPIVWPFAVGSNQANYARAIIEQANQDQEKYQFYFDSKPGAGGTIASQYVLNYNGLALLQSSSSFWTRPIYYPNESFKNADFTPVLIECTGQPFVIVSAKYKNIDELRQLKQVTIGMNFGSLTESMARALQNVLPNTEVIRIGYNNTLQPTQEMMAGVLDLNVDLPVSIAQWVDSGKLNVIGASGTVEHKPFVTFHSQGIKGFENLVSNYQIAMPAKTDPAIVRELHSVLNTAMQKSSRVKTLFANDYCQIQNFDLTNTNSIYDTWLKKWPVWINNTTGK
jgi:tripartite-type tricarboxylate transporter receptor subunit TctC